MAITFFKLTDANPPPQPLGTGLSLLLNMETIAPPIIPPVMTIPLRSQMLGLCVGIVFYCACPCDGQVQFDSF